MQARARISSTVKAIVEERRSKGEDSAGNKKSDFLEILLSANSLSEDERVSFVLDSLLGGCETTSLLMALAVLFLGQSPAALQELRSEHESIRNVKGKEEYLNWDDYKKMEFTQHVINEALRCGNMVKFVHRKALKDVNCSKYLVSDREEWLP
ncbi:cytochrome P450 724B1-like [Magnolia sinica]|uniref:cytochrome P450 724B1-like n=1 Tax=Magnolia sinica TaxID=86752 RepID=UPI002658DD03|nr:cytochrome P450 724B1-like [Magnolia sinica]